MPKKQNQTTEYGAKDIQVLEGLAPVRKRPGMYIGSTGPDGLHHLVWEVVDNSIDEAMAGHATHIEIALLPGTRVRVQDNGRGIPVDKHPHTKKSALETVLTTLHAGGKFDSGAYKVSGGLHGVGVSVVNALSTYLKAEVCRDGFLYEQEYKLGVPKTALKKGSKCAKRGTTIIFEPDVSIFKEIKYDARRILNRLRQQAYLTSGAHISFVDSREGEGIPYSFYFEGGLASYVKYLTRESTPKHDNPFYIKAERENMLIEVSFRYTEEFEMYEESFANNIHTKEGGMHITGFRSALTRTLNEYAKKNNFIKSEDDTLTGDDVREGMTAVVSVKLSEPQFEGQTKEKLGNPEAKTAVESVVAEALTDYLERNPQDSRAILEKVMLASKARKAARAARQTVLRKGALEGLALPGKLADCSSKDPEESELYIVEGDSAGGSGKQGRDRRFQAILPLRGKILNVERARLDKILTSKEVRALVIALGAAIAEDFNIEKLRYHRIIIMTDADSVPGDTPIFVLDRKTHQMRLVKIGEFIEKECDDTNRYLVLSYSQKTERFALRPIAKTIRHPLRTPLYEVKTVKGYTMQATAHHSMFAVRDGILQTLPTKDLRPGDFAVLPKQLARADQKDIVIDMTEAIRASSSAASVQVKIPAKEYALNLSGSWCDLPEASWRRFKETRMRQGISRVAMGERLGIGKTVVQQWEEKLDNVMPKFEDAARYARCLGISETEFQAKARAFYAPLSALASIPDSAEFFLGNHTNRIQRRIMLNEDLAYLLGWFAGDGCAGFSRKNPNRFLLCVGKDKLHYEEALRKAVKNALDSSLGVDTRSDGSVQFYFHSFSFKMLLSQLGLAGAHASKKQVPQAVYSATPSVQKAFLRGYLESDGSIVINKKNATYRLSHTTSSPALVDGIVTLYRQLGLFPSLSKRRAKDHERNDGVMIKNNHMGHLVSLQGIDQLKASRDIWKFHKNAGKLEAYLKEAHQQGTNRWAQHPYGRNGVLMEIKSVRRLRRKPKFVYDLSVAADENFVAGNAGLLVHNTDGSHIRTLLLTLFYRYFRPLIEKGYLYIAQPPLYKIQAGKKSEYAYTESGKDAVIAKLRKDSGKKGEEDKIPGLNIQRYKGLGEMNPEELWETTLDPANRLLLRVAIDDAKAADRIFDVLMGDEVLPRKKYIQTHAKSVQNLDV